MTVATATLRPVSFSRVKIADRFWTPRITANLKTSIPCNEQKCRETGRIDAYKLDWKPGMPKEPHKFWDSDVAKFIEAASYSLATHPDAALKSHLDEIIGLIASAQQPDGYLNPHYTVVEPEKRWTNLRDNHELYCAGHLIEAGVAYFQATGERTLLDVVCRYADYIASVFGTEPEKKRGYCGCPEIELALVKLHRALHGGYCGHPEIELALVKLHRATSNSKYLELSRYFVDERGRQPHYFDAEAIARGDDPKEEAGKFWGRPYNYSQSHKPLREQSEVTGHAVRAMYIYCAMADLALELNDAPLSAACERLWKHATSRLMYVTGGLGTSAHNEGFTFDYDLPNESAYCETCAAIAFVFWNHRLLQLGGDARYADVMERALYNGVLSGVSLDGSKFFYDNPLASRGSHHRKDWFFCSCCPPNVARLLASIGEYIYSESTDEAAIHLYVQSSTALRVAGQTVAIEQRTDYPWDGKVLITVKPEVSAHFALKLRQPGWCGKSQLSVNGKAVDAVEDRGYLRIEREWSPGDRVELNLEMPVARVYANPHVRMNCGRVVLQRGPLVYCLEGADNGADLNAIEVQRRAQFETRFEPELLGGVVTLSGRARKLAWVSGDELYSPSPAENTDVSLKAVPYFAWDNREAGEMMVWIRESV
jgi:DUF1680 family protein